MTASTSSGRSLLLYDTHGVSLASACGEEAVVSSPMFNTHSCVGLCYPCVELALWVCCPEHCAAVTVLVVCCCCCDRECVCMAAWLPLSPVVLV